MDLRERSPWSRWPGAFVAAARAGGHDLPGERARAGDHDKLPAGRADREGIGVMLLKDPQDVGDLLAAIGAGAAPADHDPLAGIGRCEPDLKPVAHTCHLPPRPGVSSHSWPG